MRHFTLLFTALAAALMLVVTCCGGGGGGSGGGGSGRDHSTTNQPVELQVNGKGMIGNIFFYGVSLTGSTPFTTVNGKSKTYIGGGYLIGSCDATDDNNNITTLRKGPFHALLLGMPENWSGILRTIDGSTSCQGPDFQWTMALEDELHISSRVHIYNVRSTLVDVSVVLDFSKDQSDEFRFSRSGYWMTVNGCQGATQSGYGRAFEAIPSEGCLVGGTDVYQGWAVESAPRGYFELRRGSLGIAFRRVIQPGSTFRYAQVIKHPGSHTMLAGWGMLNPGDEAQGNEEWQVNFLN